MQQQQPSNPVAVIDKFQECYLQEVDQEVEFETTMNKDKEELDFQ